MAPLAFKACLRCQQSIRKLMYMPNNNTSKRGFASMPEEKQRAIASKEGKTRVDNKRGRKSQEDNE